MSRADWEPALKRKSNLVWKLGGVPMVILAITLTATLAVQRRFSARGAREAAAAAQARADAVADGFGRLKAGGDRGSAFALITEATPSGRFAKDIRLISHLSGETSVSWSGDAHDAMQVTDQLCAMCHAQESLEAGDTNSLIGHTDRSGGEPVFSAMRAIRNEEGCRNAACHVHADGPSVLGFIRVDQPISPRRLADLGREAFITFGFILSALLSVALFRLIYGRLIQRPIREVAAGMDRISNNRLDHRFPLGRKDEIGALEEAYNTMVEKIRHHRDELWSVTEYLGGVVENSADIIITVTPDGFIETFNRGAEQTLGYGRAEVIGRPIEMLFADPRERDVAVARLQDTDNVSNYETRFLTKGGKTRNVLLTMSRLRDRDGNPIGTFGISKDVTEEKKLHAQLLQSQKFAAIGQAVTGIQHAIKNMLNALKGGAYLFRDGMAEDDRQLVEEGWGMIEEGIDRIRDLSDHMLFYAKEWKPRLQEVDLNELVVSLCELNRQGAVDHGVALSVEPGEGLPRVVCDQEMIHMATTDILVNAIDACRWKDYHSGERPKVVLRTKAAEGGDACVIEVCDNGCGMDEEIRRNIFTPFFSTKKTRGTGLGLALTARIIDAHNGHVSVESKLDRGAVFRIYLPVDGPRGKREAADGQADSLGG